MICDRCNNSHPTELFSVGDKVQLVSASVPKRDGEGGGMYGLDCTHVGMIGYVTGIHGDGSGKDADNCIVVREKKGCAGGDYFAPRDLIRLD